MTELDIPSATEIATCPLCGLGQGFVVGERGRFGMPVRNLCCALCATIYVSPRPSEQAMAEYYESTYRKHYGGVGYFRSDGTRVGLGDPGFDEALEAWHENQVRNTIAAVSIQPGARVLEVGCRHGRTLALLRERLHIEAFGIEPGRDEAEQARAAGIECFSGRLEDYAAPAEKFDQVQMYHVLEHLHDPLQTLVRLRSLLKPQGTLLIEVPNAYQPYGLLEENFFQNVHLYTFSPRTLPALFRRAGFRVTRVHDGSSLFVVGQRVEVVGPPPLPFVPALLGDTCEDAVWLATRLQTYGNLEKLRFVLRQKGHVPELVPVIVRTLSSPAFTEHLINTCAEFVEFFANQGLVNEAIALTQAVADGPHPESIRNEFRNFAARMRGAPEPIALQSNTIAVN